MATTVERFTYDDLESIPQEREGDRHELIDGELVVTPSPMPSHQFVSENISNVLGQFVRERNLGRIAYAPIDVRLTPDNVLIPDIIFIARERKHVVGPKTVDAPPDLVVEILSPGTRRRDQTTKRDLYARFGVREYWIVDLVERTVMVLALVSNHYEPIAPGDDGAIRSGVLPGLVLALGDVFSRVVE